LVLAGCNSLTISMNDSNPPVFSFSAGKFAECCTHLMFLNVSELPAEGEGKLIWQVWAESGTDDSPPKLPPITYGQVPPGFIQKIPEAGLPPALEEGKEYEATGPRSIVPYAYVRFRIQNGKAVRLSTP
jgi:hypothetical protein